MVRETQMQNINRGNMSETEGSNSDKVKDVTEENAKMSNTVEILQDETESILSETLKCYVCLELPAGKQVRICEEGHHFCLTCHNKMEFCGICRGRLLETRNFVVEQLVTKLGSSLGVSRCEQPAEPPLPYSPGLYKCLHCQSEMPAYKMLQHLRDKHSSHLISNVRSNPYSGRFSFRYDLNFIENGRYIWSAQVSDMGLITVELTFTRSDLFGCVRALGDKTVSSAFRCQLVAKVPNASSGSFLEFGLTDCPVSSYLDDIDSVRGEGRGLKIKGEDLSEHVKIGNPISVFFSVWKSPGKQGQGSSPSVSCPPEGQLFFENDRRVRRNRNRNIRKRKLKEKLRLSSEELVVLPQRIARIAL